MDGVIIIYKEKKRRGWVMLIYVRHPGYFSVKLLGFKKLFPNFCAQNNGVSKLYKEKIRRGGDLNPQILSDTESMRVIRGNHKHA